MGHPADSFFPELLTAQDPLAEVRGFPPIRQRTTNGWGTRP
jgi:hypothetical protein